MASRGRIALLIVALAGATHCTVTGSDDSRAIEVDVLASSVAGAPEATTDLGFEVSVARALAAVETIELLPCEGSASVSGAGLLETIGLIGVAHAHSAVEPTRTGTPAVLPLASPAGGAIDVGPLEPPPGSYCAARITLGPADADAEGMPEDGALIGRTLLVEGTRVVEGEEPAGFRLHSSDRVVVDVPIELTLGDDGRRTASVRVVLDGTRLLDGLDLATVDGEAGGDAALASLAQAAGVVVE